MDIGLILDLSGSIDESYEIVIRLAEQIIYGLPIGEDRAQVGLISYRDEAVVNIPLGEYNTKAEVLQALSFPTYGGETNTQDALKMSYRELFTGRADRSGVPNIAILITDGKSNVNADKTVREAESVKDDDIELYVMAIGDAPNMVELNEIASDPDSEYVRAVSSPQDVDRAASDLLGRICES